MSGELEVAVETFVATAAADPSREVRPKLWRVRVNGMHAGFVGWKPGSKLLMHLRFSPEEMRHIESEVAKQLLKLNDWTPPEDSDFSVESVVPAEVPEEKVKPSDDGIDIEDFE